MDAGVVQAHAVPVASGDTEKEFFTNTNGVRYDYNSTTARGQTDILTRQAEGKEAFGDWRDDFFKDGYYVVKGAIPRERADAYREKSLDWLSKFEFGFDFNDESTWVQKHLPMMMKGGMVLNYCAAHEKWVWDARCEDGVIEPFAKLWGTDELLVSFDSVNITLPRRKDVSWSPWPHVDQAPTRKGLACIQGIINLSEAGPKDGGLQLFVGSSRLFDRFFEENPPGPKDPNAPDQYDWYGYTEENVKWFEEHGCKLVKVNAEPGDLIIWDSRSVHYASKGDSDTIRSVLYASYAPAKLASPEDLALKAKLFQQHEGSTHWPHCNIHGQGKALRDGQICPGERDEPLEKPVLTEKLVKLAGVKAY